MIQPLTEQEISELEQRHPDVMKNYFMIFNDKYPELGAEIGRALLNIAGEKLGDGSSRTVYTHRTNPDVVIKLTLQGFHSSPNKREHKFWNHVSEYHKNLADWFAPVRYVSEYGAVLIQDRMQCDKSLIRKEMRQVPDMFLKYSSDMTFWCNWGMDPKTGQFKCVDYPHAVLPRVGILQRLGIRRESDVKLIDIKDWKDDNYQFVRK